MSLASFESAGYALVADVLSWKECASIAKRIRPGTASGGTRCLLEEPWCVALAQRLRQHTALSAMIPATHLAVQCTYFEKSTSRNWLVPIHQDLSISVATRVDEPGLRGWSEKEGALFVQAPIGLLEQLVAVRLHLDECTVNDGPLRVLPASHSRGLIPPDEAITLRRATTEVTCHAERGTALVMRPLLLHASSKSTGASQRRVLHFVYGPPRLTHGLQWRIAI